MKQKIFLKKHKKFFGIKRKKINLKKYKNLGKYF